MKKSKIKVLFLIHDLGQGGAEKVLVNLVNNMDQDKFEIHVTAVFGGGVNEQFLKPHVRFRTVIDRKVHGNSRIMKLLSPKELHRLCVKEHYDVEIAYLEGPDTRIISGCTDPDTKLIAWFHSMQFTMEELACSFRSKREAIQAYERFDRIICVSRMMKKQIDSLLHMDNKTKVYYNTIESDLIRELTKEPAEEIEPGPEIRLIATGSLKKVKGFDRLLRVTKNLIEDGHELKLYILGCGPLQEEFETFIKVNKLEKQVFFLGYKVNPYKYLARSSLFVCSSFSEGFSTAVTESLIVGLPVITTDVSGMREMLGNHNEYGIVVENDEDALCAGLKNLISDPGLLEYYKGKARERGAFFDKQVTVEAVESLLIGLAEG